MGLPIFPFSPLPANLQRSKNWGELVTRYDSGAKQGSTAYVRPLYDWVVPIKLMTEIKQAALWAFWDTVKGTTLPFLMKDAYDFCINSVVAVSSGITNAATLFLFDTNSYFIRVDTTFVSTLLSASSGFVTLGHEYNYDQDSGLFTVNTKAPADIWTVQSAQYYKKASFNGDYQETSQLWNIFATQLTIEELP